MATQEQIEKYKAAGAKVMIGEHAFKPPSRAEYDRWVDGKVSGSPASVNARQLAQACCVSSWDDLTVTLDARPAMLLNEVLSEILELAGAGGENVTLEVKKL